MCHMSSIYSIVVNFHVCLLMTRHEYKVGLWIAREQNFIGDKILHLSLANTDWKRSCDDSESSENIKVAGS